MNNVFKICAFTVMDWEGKVLKNNSQKFKIFYHEIYGMWT